MEYLTLQDIPHRHHDQQLSRRMTSHSSERPLGHMAAASHHMRSSPPIQPGEQNIPAKLPSFSEFLNTTRQHTPPRTPSRRNDSADNSPHAQPHFEDVAWSRRGRHDTVADIYNRNSSVSEHHASDMRRMSNAIDPSLSAYGPERSSQLLGAPVAPIVQQHRPSHSYPPPHVRNQSPGVPHYAHQHQSHGSLSHIPYAGSHAQPSSAAYENRPGYYQEAPHHSYAYDRPGEAYYGRPQYTTHASAYDNNYGELRFQQHVGLDQNAFNRKRRGNLPKEATNLLKDWFQANRASPYPSEDQKMELCARTGLSLNQVSNWFINARRRQPQKEAREQATNGQNGLDG